MITKSIICKGQARTIEDVVCAWMSDHHEAMGVRDVEDVIELCLSLRDILISLNKDAWEQLLANKLRNVIQAGDILQKTVVQVLTTLESVHDEGVQGARQKGYEVDNADRLDEAIEQVRRLKQDFEARWPFFDQRQLGESRANIARGEYQTVEEILGELQGHHPEKH